ncbi:helical backbone metal receptor [Kitasatospora cathayae]|uniref:Helical backbone metal receptor n=1 Tax=Kitasatospora cathayae TaxID=3004092 RepID=A0ABY7Q077_9ACTN|nr:helical backbone metal receptor [Kitasatospora sp. HUAS 3-15]WBP86021.1 helical backbone metal receptor [Kitasatospora sp. HUAS 3-15]
MADPTEARDDLDLPVPLGPHPPRRVVSLVPSLTEAVAATAPGLLVGATNWCSHPADLAVTRIGGTKNPDLPGVLALAPDLVIANDEENRRPDLDALRAAGVPVWATDIRTLDDAFRSLERLLTVACRLPRPYWLDQAEAAWRDVRPAGARPDVPPTSARQDAPPTAARQDVRPAADGPRAIVPIWRRPWMVLGRDTFAGDLLHRLGLRLVHAEHPERYPAVPLPELLASRPELVVLPDEPYRFTAEDGPEAFPGIPVALVSGRHLTWYGPSLVTAPAVLRRAIDHPFVQGARTTS